MNALPTWYISLGITSSQWRYYRFWLCAILITEGLMFVFNRHLVLIYFIIALLFGAGFLLRVSHLYPGQNEPLILDFFAVCIAFLLGWGAHILNDSPWRFLMILCSSIIIWPHFVYIAREK